MTESIMTLILTNFMFIQYNDNRISNTQHNITHHDDNQLLTTLCITALSIMIINILVKSRDRAQNNYHILWYAECRYTERRKAKCR